MDVECIIPHAIPCYDRVLHCGNTPSKRKYKNCWIRAFGTPEITSDYCSTEWSDFAQMSVYGAIVGRENNQE